jgi:hypothetical protein
MIGTLLEIRTNATHDHISRIDSYILVARYRSFTVVHGTIWGPAIPALFWAGQLYNRGKRGPE